MFCKSEVIAFEWSVKMFRGVSLRGVLTCMQVYVCECICITQFCVRLSKKWRKRINLVCGQNCCCRVQEHQGIHCNIVQHRCTVQITIFSFLHVEDSSHKYSYRWWIVAGNSTDKILFTNMTLEANKTICIARYH